MVGDDDYDEDDDDDDVDYDDDEKEEEDEDERAFSCFIMLFLLQLLRKPYYYFGDIVRIFLDT